jgi:MoxR-like ATPase
MSPAHQNKENDPLGLRDPAEFGDALPLEDSVVYLFDQDVRLAVRMAWVTSRPLLVVGEAGCGKTHLAKALARAWQVPLLSKTVHARTEAQDLFYHFDAVARLADAQLRSALGGAAVDAEIVADCDPRNPEHYLRPEILWWALNASSARALNTSRPSGHRFHLPPGLPESWAGGASVVLIDEVDKGSDELAESLLEVLGEGSFLVPWTGRKIESDPSSSSKSFLLLTSNGSRPLPAPFLRRCIVLSMQVGADVVSWLCRRGRAHFTPAQVKDAALQRAAELIAEDREKGASERRYKPGLAEFLYLCEAVAKLAAEQPADVQRGLIDDLAPSVTRHKGDADRFHA